jgi:hypothetical protein
MTDRAKHTREADRDKEFAITAVMVNGRQFLSGLHWAPLVNSRGYMREARAMGKKQGWDVVAIRRGERIQAGFVAHNSTNSAGMYSLAASLAGILGSQWIGAFSVNDGRYAVVAVREGSIIPGFDVIVSREMAMEMVKQAYNLFSKETKIEVYVPADFEFGGRELQLAELLQAKNLRSHYKLRALKFPVGQIVLVAGLMLLLFVGWKAFQGYMAERAQKARIELARRKAQELADLNARSKAAQKAKALEHPWAKMPGAMDVVTRCVDGLHSIPLSMGGWVVHSAECDEDRITADFRRKGGTVDDFRGVSQYYFKTIQITDNGEKASVSNSMMPLKAIGDDPLQKPDEIQSKFESRMQRLGLKLEITEKNVVLPKLKPIPGEPEEPPPPATWRLFPFMFEGPLNPVGVLEGMESLDGIRVKSLKVQISEDGQITWFTTGEVYASK